MIKKYFFLFCVVLSLAAVCVGCNCEHEWADATCTEPQTCVHCGATKGDALGHEWRDATFVNPKTCLVCNATEGGTLFEEHLKLFKSPSDSDSDTEKVLDGDLDFSAFLDKIKESQQNETP